MAYPDICYVYCRNFGTPDCPTSSECMALRDKPYFRPKACESWLDRWKRRRYQKKQCESVHYRCTECIYHDFHFDGTVFRGTTCRLEVRK